MKRSQQTFRARTAGDFIHLIALIEDQFTCEFPERHRQRVDDRERPDFEAKTQRRRSSTETDETEETGVDDAEETEEIHHAGREVESE